MIAPSVRPRRNEAVVRSSPRRSCAAAPTGRGSPRPTRSPIPTQATIDAASRWKSPIVRRSKPSRSARASPAHAPRIAASDDDRQPPAGGAADEHEQRRVEDADEDGEDERRVEAHAPVDQLAGRADVASARRRRPPAAPAARSARRRARPRRRTGPRPGRAPRPRPACRSRRSSDRRGRARDAVAGRTVAAIGVARWRIRISARNGDRGRSARRRRRSDARSSVDRRSSRGPRAGRA